MRRALLAPFIGLGFLCAPAADAAPKDDSQRIVVVDINRVLDGWKQVQLENVRMDVEAKELRAKLSDFEKNIKALESSVKILEGKAKQEKEQELAAKKREFESTVSVQGGRLDRMQAEALGRWYREIAKAVDECARKDGIDFVLVSESRPDFPTGQDFSNPKEMDAAFREFQKGVTLHKVLYARAELDITQKVIDLLNAGSEKK